MADVLIVCVREDEPQAKALADMFEAAGFSVGGAPSSDSALRSSGAGLVVWSQASIRSRPFLDAAQRVINADKAVVASLIEPPPPDSIGDAQAFDLSGWTGDPDDPALDPLFFAVDRMVNSQRAAVGAPSAQPATMYQQEPPPVRAAPSYTRPSRPTAPPPAAPQSFQMRTPQRQAPAPSGGGADLGSEAEHWRAIRNSREPADFMDYLARYGPEGAFAEVAELRLKQLTQPGGPAPILRAPTPAPRPAPPPPPPARAYEPPPKRPDPPVRRAEPPRRDPPKFERTYDRAPEAAPRQGGGALRGLIVLALLGGAALAAGLYFGGGRLPEMAALTEATDSAPNPLAETAPPATEPEAAPMAEDFAPPERQQVAARRPPPAATTTPQRQTQQEAEDGPPPPPVTSWTGEAATSGPVSLSPSSEQASNTPSVVVPLAPPPSSGATTTAAAATTNAAQTPAGAAGTVLWAQRPSARRIAELYPSRALREGVGGRVVLDCTVRANLSAACAVASETPATAGFGNAALGAVTAYRSRATLSDGSSAAGTNTRIVITFRPPAE